MTDKHIAWFSDIDKDDTAQVGGKGANLGEMAGLGLPVPPGFVVSASAYRDFLKENGLEKKIRQILESAKVNDPISLSEASATLKKLITSAPIPQVLASEIIDAYLSLGRQLHKKSTRLAKLLAGISPREVAVAVRSSATAEDSKTASFAGQNETFLNIYGEANLVETVRRCWASLFDARSIFYREQNHLDHFKSEIAVVIQVMVPSEASGVLFSIDPVTNNKQRIIIEAIFGLGEYIVQGKVTPDHYEVAKADLKIVEEKVAVQKIMLTRNTAGKTREQPVPKNKQQVKKLTDGQIVILAEMAKKLEEHYYFPQDSEFSVFKGNIFLVQTRPVTTTSLELKRPEQVTDKAPQKALKILLVGAPASPGVRSGPVKILQSAKEINRLLPGDILVASQTNPDYVPAMKKAAAIVTDRGGRTSHAAIVSRELGIPCVVGTEKATSLLKDGQIVTVNGTEGKVFLGSGVNVIPQAPAKKNITGEVKIEALKTATKVYVNLAEPEKARQVAAQNCDGVGLLRAEFMLAGLGIHPKKVIQERTQKVFVTALANQILEFAQAFYPRPVVYRTTDFKTNEYRSLKGGEKYEPNEENPMIGFRGAYRYLVQPEVFRLEVEAIKIVREKYDFKNLWLMIPFCRTPRELELVKSLLSKFGLHRSPSFQLWMMAEIPSNVILLDKFIETGLDGISIGSNDLTMLTLGVDRDNENVAKEYNELDQSLLFSFYKIIKTCQKYHVACSMCGQAPSDYPELTDKLVQLGINSVSVNPDAIDRTREIVYGAEKRLAAKR